MERDLSVYRYILIYIYIYIYIYEYVYIHHIKNNSKNMGITLDYISLSEAHLILIIVDFPRKIALINVTGCSTNHQVTILKGLLSLRSSGYCSSTVPFKICRLRGHIATQKVYI